MSILPKFFEWSNHPMFSEEIRTIDRVCYYIEKDSLESYRRHIDQQRIEEEERELLIMVS